MQTKIGTEVAHVTRDSGIIFKVKRSKVNLQGLGYCSGLPQSLLIRHRLSYSDMKCIGELVHFLCRIRRRRRRRNREGRRRQATAKSSEEDRGSPPSLSRSRRAATARTERLWDHGVIPYEIETNFSGRYTDGDRFLVDM